MAKKKISVEALGRLEHAGQNPAEAFLSATDAKAMGLTISTANPTHQAIRRPVVEIENIADDPDLKIYTLTDLETILGLSHRSLLEYVKLGKIKAVKIGTKWRVSRRNLLAYIHGEQ